MSATKTCDECGATKPLPAFAEIRKGTRAPESAECRRSTCKTCVREAYDARAKQTSRPIVRLPCGTLMWVPR